MEINVPKSWDDITLDQFVQLSEVTLDMPEPEGTLLRLSILMGVDVEVIQEMPFSQFESACKSIDFATTLPTGSSRDEINGYDKINLNGLSVGKFIDMEERQKTEHMSFILACMYPKRKEFDGNDKYSYKAAIKHAEKFRNVPITSALPAFMEYQKWREKIFNSYRGLFKSVDKTEDVEVQGESAAQRRKRISDQAAAEAKAAKWNWFGFLSGLAGHDPLKYEAASELNIVFALNHLSYLKENEIQSQS